MMVEIDDAMVERALHAAAYDDGSATRDPEITGYIGAGAMRRALNAALNPPAEPEIVVTEEQLRAASAAVMAVQGSVSGINTVTVGGLTNSQFGKLHAATYRAMRALEPKPDRRKGERRYRVWAERADGTFIWSRTGSDRRKGART